ncbi:MAG TPA: DUF3710 domain-containing protein [Trebonia sp.]|nr:DUF3710 domain-containing protein [Trebonia sp.]
MFGRRRSGSHSRGQEDRAAEAPGPELADEPEQPAQGEPDAGGPTLGGGPYDAGDSYPEMPRADLGSLLVPVVQEYEVQLIVAENQGAWVAVGHSGSQVQLQAFAAPRREAIWGDVRAEIVAEIAGASGQSTEREGPFGTELTAQVPVQPGNPAAGFMPVRFIGVDGPRWFLRGLFQGAAATDPAAAAPLEALIREVVVIRGEHPMPPRDLLELRLPPEAQQALADQQAQAGQQDQQDQQQGGYDLNPFERGPEITETRLSLGA